MHGWRTGQFPPPFMEWNDRYRDAVRRFWVIDVRGPGARPALARPAGPRHPARRVARPVRPPRPGADRLGQLRRRARRLHPRRPHRRTTTSTTRPTARTTATAATATRSWNHGVEGPTDDAGGRRGPRAHHPQPARHAAALHRRADAQRGRRDRAHPGRQQQRLLPGQRDRAGSTGTSPRGSATCSRPPGTSRGCAASCPALRQRVWALGRQVHDDGSRDMEWYAADGARDGPGMGRPGTRVVQMYVDGAWMGADSALVVVNGSAHQHEVTLPRRPASRHTGCSGTATDERPRPQGSRGRRGR